MNIEKTGMLADIGVQFPKSIYDTVTCYDDSIAYSTENVKSHAELSKNKSVKRNVHSESVEKKPSVIGEISTLQSKQKQERDNSPKPKIPKKKKNQHL